MALVIDNITETHDGAEPRVLRHEVRMVLNRVIRPGDDDNGESVIAVADRAKVSTRTIYRVLAPDEFDADGVLVNESLSLDIADRLCRACGTHMALANCRLKWWDGQITPYVSLRGLTLRPVN